MRLHPSFRRLVAAAAIVVSPIVAEAGVFEKLDLGRRGELKPLVEVTPGGKPGPVEAPKPPRGSDVKGPTEAYEGPRDVLVELNASKIHKRAERMRSKRGLKHDDKAIRKYKVREFRRLQTQFASKSKKLGVKVKSKYRNFPAIAVHIENDEDLARLERRKDVVAVHENIIFEPFLAESLPQIGHPRAMRMGATGRNTSVAVLDTGVDFTDPAFGSCTSVGEPASCRVAFAGEFATPDGSLDDDSHGTNVAGIVLGVAPRTNILSLDVFNQTDDGQKTDVLGLALAIDFLIDTKFLFNTVAMNLSLGSHEISSRGRCLSPVDPLFAEAQAVGIMPIVAAGNDGDPSRISLPACSPYAVAVGAVDEDDAVTEFSNSSNGLDLLAPGTDITAAGFTKSGTSMATPHVAGAFALLREARRDLNQYQVLQALKDTGVAITDPRQGRVTPRIQLDRALAWSPYLVLPAPLENYLNLGPIEWAWAQCQIEEIADGIECGWERVIEPITSEILCGLEQITDEVICGSVEIVSEAVCGVVSVVDSALCGVEEIVLNPLDVLSGMDCSCNGFQCSCTIASECDVADSCFVPDTCEVPATCPQERSCNPLEEDCNPLSCEVEVCEF